MKQAIVICGIFEFAGASLLGAAVADTVRKGIVDVSLFQFHPALLMTGMVCASLSTGIWLMFASLNGLPVSTTHSTIGSIIGFALAAAPGFGVPASAALNWTTVANIVASWFISPMLSALLSMLLFGFVRSFILRGGGDSTERALRFLPGLIALMVAVNLMYILYVYFRLRLPPQND
jgi:phosphate/sulfate permease